MKPQTSLSPSPPYRFCSFSSVSQRPMSQKEQSPLRPTQSLCIVCILFLLLLSLTSSSSAASASSRQQSASASSAAQVFDRQTPSTAVPKCHPNESDWLVWCGHLSELSFTASSQMSSRQARFAALGTAGYVAPHCFVHATPRAYVSLALSHSSFTLY